MGAPPPPGTQPNPTAEGMKMLGMMVFFGAVMYLVLIRPQQKKAKEHTKLLQSLKRGDRIVTSGGVVGLVLQVKDKTVTIKSEDTKLEILKSAVAEVTERSADSAS